MANHVLKRVIHIPDALKLGLDLQGELPLSELPRLNAKAYDPEGQVNYHFKIHQGIDSLVKLKLQVSLQLSLQCQRCLKPLTLVLDNTVELVPIYKPEQAKTLDPDFEPLDLSGGKITYFEVLEDECLLALPQVPRHDNLDCQNS